MLFQSYTGGRPAEFVHSSKGKASDDPLGKAEDTNKCEPPQEVIDGDYSDESDAGEGPDYDDGDLCEDDENAADEDTDETADRDSGYNTDVIEVTMTEHTDNCYMTEIDESTEPVRQNCDADELDEFGEAIRKYKALCYEDICFWIVQNPKQGERDLLAMEVHLRHHKGVDNKPKPYVASPYVLSLG